MCQAGGHQLTAIVLAVLLAALGVAATIAVDIRRHRNRLSTPPIGTIKSIRSWRSIGFYRALSCVQSYTERLNDFTPFATSDSDTINPAGSTANRERVTLEDLIEWSVQALLSCASRIDPRSQGKANLFKVKRWIEESPRQALLTSESFSGIFPIEQVSDETDEGLVYRDIVADPDVDHPTNFVAVKCARSDTILLENVHSPFQRTGASLSDDERRLGTTDIIGIPLCRQLAHARVDQLVAITIDLRMSSLSSGYHRWRWQSGNPRRSRILKRCEHLQGTARQVVEAITRAQGAGH